MLPVAPEGAGIALPSADREPQQPPAPQQPGHEAEGVIQAPGPQPEQQAEADAKLKVQAWSSPKASPAPSSSTMGTAGGPDEEAAGAAAGAAAAAAAAGGGRAEQPPGKAPATGAKQGKKKVVRSKDEFNEVWKKFMKSRQLDTSPQQFNRQALDLFKLFRLVLKAGGYQTVLEQKGWARIGRHFNPPPSMTDLSYQIKKAYINKLLAFEEAYNAGQIDAEFVLEGGGTPEPATKAPPKRKAAEPAEAAEAAPKPKRERQQPKQQPKQQQQQRARVKEERKGGGLVVKSPQAPQQPPARPRAKQTRPSHKRAASLPREAGKGGKSAKAAACPPSTAAGRGARQDGGGVAWPEARPPSGKRQRVLQRRIEPPEVVTSPEAMIGRRIGVFWADDDTFYHGTVVGYNPTSERHMVQYDDGDREDLMLAYEDWAFLDKHHRAAQAAAAAARSGAHAPDQQPGPPAGPADAAPASVGGHPHMQAAPAPHYQLQRPASGPGSHEPGLAAPVQYAAHLAGGGFQLAQQVQQQAQAQQPPPPPQQQPPPPQQLQQAQQAQQALGPLVLPDFAVPSSGVPPLFRQASADDQALLVPSLHPQGSLPGTLPGMLGADGELEPTPRHTVAQTLQWVANGGPPAGGTPAPGPPPAGHPAAQQQQWLYQSQQQFAPDGGYGSAYGGYPASGPLPAAHAASLGLPPLPPRTAPAGVGGFAPPPPPVHRTPHDLVAQGRNYRAYTTMDPAAGYEVFALVPGLTADEVSVRCWSSGVVLIEGEPVNAPSGPGAQAPLSEHVQLPTRIDTRSAVAQLTPTGQLYLRVNAV